MTGPEHYRAAELLLLDCQLPGQQEEDGAEVYPALEWAADPNDPDREVNSVANAIAAAQVHATLAAAAATAASLGTFLELEAAAKAWSAVTA